LRLYLLKLVSEAELDQIEDAYLSTSEHVQLIEDAENRLVSDFVQGRLSDEEERAFTNNYLVTAARREQVAIARALGDLEQSEQPEGIWQHILNWATPRPGLTLAATVAAGVFAITSVVMFLGWRGQIQSTVALQHAQELRNAPAKGEPRVLSARTLSVPVLRADEVSLAAGQTQKLTFRLPSDLLDAIEIPLISRKSRRGLWLTLSCLRPERRYGGAARKTVRVWQTTIRKVANSLCHSPATSRSPIQTRDR